MKTETEFTYIATLINAYLNSIQEEHIKIAVTNHAFTCLTRIEAELRSNSQPEDSSDT